MGDRSSSASPDAPGWRSKSRRPSEGSTEKAHFVEAGRPICSAIMFRDGPALFPFKTYWEPLRDYDMRCGLCRRLLAQRKDQRT